MLKNRKADAVNIGSINYQNIAGGKDGDFVYDYAENLENLQSEISGMIAPAPKVKKLHRCQCCGVAKSADKFSVFYPMCRDCLNEAKQKGKIARANFISRAVANFERSLRGGLKNV